MISICPKVAIVLLVACHASAFTPPTRPQYVQPHASRVAPVAGFSEDYGWGEDVTRRAERSARAAAAGEVVYEVTKPLGLVLEEDKEGNVFVAGVKPGSNAAKAGLKEGLEISMVSATFGNDMWSTKGAGLSRVMKAIKVRVGTSVKLVAMDKKNAAKIAKLNVMSAAKRRELEEAEQERKDRLLAEIKEETDEARKKLFGIF
mmetsp:Transcript_15369/g.20641  ORF Transcript_15369/g.20641 Transcript_15369/m.20641 type:complete len:203 (-) Transcript_15369:136-744(-)